MCDLREALKLAPNNLQLHAFSIQVKTQLEAKNNMKISAASAKGDGGSVLEIDAKSAAVASKIVEDEICALPEENNMKISCCNDNTNNKNVASVS